jgi:hypothetical protein
MPPSPHNPPSAPLGKGDWSAWAVAMVALLTVIAFLVMGYHPGLEDDAFYLAAIKRNLNPALFPHDADFFRLQFQATVFDKLIAASVRLTHVPLAWAAWAWQFAAIFFLLHGCWRISRRSFAKPEAQWAAVATIAALLTLPVSGIAINLADQYLHPRTLATAVIMAAVVAVLDRRLWLAGILLAVAFAIHAIMTVFGVSFCAFLYWSLRPPESRRLPATAIAAALLIPLGWMFEPASDAWRQAAATRSFYFLAGWEWYEWLGVFAPLVLLFACRRFLRRRRGSTEFPALVPLVSGLLNYGAFQTVVGLAVMLPPRLERVRPFEPMRYLHLLYLFFFLIAGGFLGSHVLHRRVYRWALLFLPLSASMFYAQRQMYSASRHVELPFLATDNGWLRAFAWIRQNTPVDTLFAVDPHYETLPDEDYHGFRALAERSVLTDYEKDGGMVCRVPRLAPRWLQEVTALKGWHNFQPSDFQRLKHDFGVQWVVLSRADARYSVSDATDMTCPYLNQEVKVCRLY